MAEPRRHDAAHAAAREGVQHHATRRAPPPVREFTEDRVEDTGRQPGTRGRTDYRAIPHRADLVRSCVTTKLGPNAEGQPATACLLPVALTGIKHRERG